MRPQAASASAVENENSIAPGRRIASPARIDSHRGRTAGSGNLGTIARSAEAFGATGMLLGDGAVSQWNWKALRASAGSMFRVPAVKVELASAIRELKARGLEVLATSSHKGTPISQADLRRPRAVLVGNEGSGLPKVSCPRRMKSWLFHSRRALSHSTQASPHRSFFTKPPRQRNYSPGRHRSAEE